MDDKKTPPSPTETPQDVMSGEMGSIHELKTMEADGIDPVFEAQATLINHAVQQIGMGKVKTAVPSLFTTELMDISTNGRCSVYVGTAGFAIRYVLPPTSGCSKG
jgi:hypothetical protein